MLVRFLLIVVLAGGFAFDASTCAAQSSGQVKQAPAGGKQAKGKNKTEKNTGAEERTYASFRDAMSAGYELKNEGKIQASRLAYEAALLFEPTKKEKCDVYQSLLSIYPEVDDWDSLYLATEYIVENAPYPAFASLSVRSAIAAVSRKKKQDSFFEHYEAKLKANPADRTALTILEKAVQLLVHDLPRRADYLQRLIDLDIKEGKTPDPEMRAQLAFMLKLSHKEVESAEMYQSIADSTKDYRAYCLAQAAESWERAGEREKSIAAAVEASNLGPDVRANRSLYDWHRLLGDLFLKHLAKAPAKKHYTAALENAPIDQYRKQCQEQLNLVDALKD